LTQLPRLVHLPRLAHLLRLAHLRAPAAPAVVAKQTLLQ